MKSKGHSVGRSSRARASSHLASDIMPDRFSQYITSRYTACYCINLRLINTVESVKNNMVNIIIHRISPAKLQE